MERRKMRWGDGVGGVFHDTRMKARPSPWGCRGDGNSREAVMGEKGTYPLSSTRKALGK